MGLTYSHRAHRRLYFQPPALPGRQGRNKVVRLLNGMHRHVVNGLTAQAPTALPLLHVVRFLLIFRVRHRILHLAEGHL